MEMSVNSGMVNRFKYLGFVEQKYGGSTDEMESKIKCG